MFFTRISTGFELACSSWQVLRMNKKLIIFPVLSGIAAARQMLANDPQSRIMFMSANGSPAMVEAAMRMGVRGYLLKSDAHQIVAAMDAISQGQAFISEGLTRRSDT